MSKSVWVSVDGRYHLIAGAMNPETGMRSTACGRDTRYIGGGYSDSEADAVRDGRRICRECKRALEDARMQEAWE